MSDPAFVYLPCVPAPVVEQAVDNILIPQNPDDAGGITVDVARWPFMLVNQRATLYVCGQTEDDASFLLRIADAEPVTPSEAEAGWSRTIAWAYLANLKHRSQLVFIFQVAMDGNCCACPLLFPPVSLQVSVPWQDLTTFTDGDYNGWEAGPAAVVDLRDLSIVKLPDGNEVLLNNTYSSQSNGVVLFKTYSELRVGEVYEFSMRSRRLSLASAKPILALQADDAVVAGPEEIPGTDWVILRGSFTASAGSMTLNIVSEVATGSGNDYYLDDILLRTL